MCARNSSFRVDPVSAPELTRSLEAKDDPVARKGNGFVAPERTVAIGV